MTGAQHTPGPWLVDDEAQIIAGNRVIAHAEPRLFTRENAWDWDGAFANAQLIAASPDLVDELRKAAEALERCAWREGQMVDPDAEASANAARAVIAKATGSQA